MLFGKKEPMYDLRLSYEELDFIIICLIEWKNKLTREGRYTDAIDDALLQLMAVR